MPFLSPAILSVFAPFAILFSRPVWNNALTLLIGTLLCRGKRTVCAALSPSSVTCCEFSNSQHVTELGLGEDIQIVFTDSDHLEILQENLKNYDICVFSFDAGRYIMAQTK